MLAEITIRKSQEAIFEYEDFVMNSQEKYGKEIPPPPPDDEDDEFTVKRQL